MVSHAESIAIINSAGRKFTPELKTFTRGNLTITYDQVRQKVVDEYKNARIEPSRVFLQSFNEPDVMYWVTNEPAFGAQAVMLDGNYAFGGNAQRLGYLGSMGVRYVAPPIGQLITLAPNGMGIVPSPYVAAANTAGMRIITWTVERNYACWPAQPATRANATACQSFNELELIDALHNMGVVGVFSDWPATTTFYANCMITSPRDYSGQNVANVGPRPE